MVKKHKLLRSSILLKKQAKKSNIRLCKPKHKIQIMYNLSKPAIDSFLAVSPKLNQLTKACTSQGND